MDRENNHSGSKNTPSIYLLESIDAWIPIQIIYTHGHFQDCTIWVWAACVDTRNRSFSKLEKKKHKGVIYYSRFSTHFLSFFIFWYYLYQTYGIICDKCQGTSCEVPYVQLKLIERFWVLIQDYSRSGTFFFSKVAV